MEKKYTGIPFVKLENGNNLVKVEDIYGFNNSDEEYTELTDEMLEIFNNSRKEKKNKKRDDRRKSVVSFDEELAAKLEGINIPSAESTYLSENNKEDMEELRRIIGTLSKIQRRRLFMRYGLNMTYKEIGNRERVCHRTVVDSCEEGLMRLRKESKVLQNLSLDCWIHLLICTNF